MYMYLHPYKTVIVIESESMIYEIKSANNWRRQSSHEVQHICCRTAAVITVNHEWKED